MPKLMPSSPASSPAGWPLHILYADSPPEFRDLMRDRLELDGHQVETAADGAEALDRIAHAAFDLVIADHDTTRVDGLDLVWHLRQLPYAGKVVILSTGLSPAVSARYERAGVALLVTKPIFPPTFCLRLHQLFPTRAPAIDQVRRPIEDSWASGKSVAGRAGVSRAAG